MISVKKFVGHIVLVIVLISVCCSCGEKPVFTEGNLLYDLGAESIDDIEKVEFLYEEYQRSSDEKIRITDKEDIEILCNYTYASDFPSDKVHELLVYPNDSIYVTVKGVEYWIDLDESGELRTVPGNYISKARIYKAEKGKRITRSVWKRLIEKYQ